MTHVMDRLQFKAEGGFLSENIMVFVRSSNLWANKLSSNFFYVADNEFYHGLLNNCLLIGQKVNKHRLSWKHYVHSRKKGLSICDFIPKFEALTRTILSYENKQPLQVVLTTPVINDLFSRWRSMPTLFLRSSLAFKTWTTHYYCTA